METKYKITKIKWNCDDPKMNLPENLITKRDTIDLPRLMKKKYGYDVEGFSSITINIPETLDEFFSFLLPDKSRKEKIFYKGGKLSGDGKRALVHMKMMIEKIFRQEQKGVDEFNLPKEMIELWEGFENVTGIKWGDHTAEELLNAVKDKVRKMAIDEIKTKVKKEKTSKVKKVDEVKTRIKEGKEAEA